MGKVIFVFSGVFVAAVICELINRTNPAFAKKVEDFAHKKIDGVAGGQVITLLQASLSHMV